MALSNLYDWSRKSSSSWKPVGSACGSSDKRSVNSSACGSADKVVSSACGSGDKKVSSACGAEGK
ncbi:ACGX-repeat peptide [Candidatus Saccharibacteria bacterium]|nr:ACGX-repeat peptide [Candidatus Saccharibacteria bacterium]MBR3368955.1 ACGX-repeat peptide [Candidatus Saccharibacteria bacterium]